MADLLVYWRDCLANREEDAAADGRRVWHSSSRLIAGLKAGDRLWLVCSGQGLGLEPAHRGWLVEVWQVERAKRNPGDDVRYSSDRYTHRVEARVDEELSPARPFDVDPLVRPDESELEAPIGRLLQGPRRLSLDTVNFMAVGISMASMTPPRPVATTKRTTSDAIDRDQIALGIRQPWAELILRGVKTIEVRSQPTTISGPIYLYTSKVLADIPAAAQAIRSHKLDAESLPKGAIVGSVQIIDCRPCTRDDARDACVPASVLAGRQAWVLGHPERLALPVKPRFLPYGVWFYPFRRRNAETG
jgi:hypothetical protein